MEKGETTLYGKQAQDISYLLSCLASGDISITNIDWDNYCPDKIDYTYWHEDQTSEHGGRPTLEMSWDWSDITPIFVLLHFEYLTAGHDRATNVLHLKTVNMYWDIIITAAEMGTPVHQQACNLGDDSIISHILEMIWQLDLYSKLREIGRNTSKPTPSRKYIVASKIDNDSGTCRTDIIDTNMFIYIITWSHDGIPITVTTGKTVPEEKKLSPQLRRLLGLEGGFTPPPAGPDPPTWDDIPVDQLINILMLTGYSVSFTSEPHKRTIRIGREDHVTGQAYYFRSTVTPEQIEDARFNLIAYTLNQTFRCIKKFEMEQKIKPGTING